MKKTKTTVMILLAALLAAAVLVITKCGRTEKDDSIKQVRNTKGGSTKEVDPGHKIVKLEKGLSAVRYDGDYGFEDYLRQGGASSDSEVIKFITGHLGIGPTGLGFRKNVYGCSTISVMSPKNEALFGRNFDWESCEAMITVSKPDTGYASVSTVNMDFINAGSGFSVSRLPSRIQAMAALYAPLDGMNEKGLCVSVNMIQDSDTIEQNTEKPDITTTTAVRLLLNKAADVKEALELLDQYDLHASKGMMIHFAIADSSGRSVAAEYVNDQMTVTDTPVVTNFYLAEGEKKGIGTEQSHTRYGILTKQLSKTPAMGMEHVRDALESVSKKNFGEFESTEWSIVFNQKSKEVRYYHREDYDNSYRIYVK